MAEPFVVTVIPTFQEVEYIERCLKSLIHQTWPSNRHLIHVVDGGSDDGTRDIVASMAEFSAEINGPEVLLIDNPDQFVAEARNLSLSHTPEQTTHLLEMIGHVWVPLDHIERRMVEYAEVEDEVRQRGGKLAGIGTLVKESDENLGMVGRWIEATLQNPLASGKGQFAQFRGRSETLVPPFTLYSVEAVRSLGGWNPRFITTQDSELNMRLRHAGWSLQRSDASYCHMAKRKSISGWLKFAHRYGFWRTKHLLQAPKRVSILEFLPLIGLLLTITLLFTELSTQDVPLWIGPPLVYLVVLTLHGLLEGISRRQPTLVFGLPLLLVLLHISFTIGLADGLVRKGRPPRDRVA